MKRFPEIIMFAALAAMMAVLEAIVLLAFVVLATALLTGCKAHVQPQTPGMERSFTGATTLTEATRQTLKLLGMLETHVDATGKPLLNYGQALVGDTVTKAENHEIELAATNIEVQQMKEWGLEQQKRGDVYEKSLGYRVEYQVRYWLWWIRVVFWSGIGFVVLCGIAGAFVSGPAGLIGGRIFKWAVKTTMHVGTLGVVSLWNHLRGKA